MYLRCRSCNKLYTLERYLELIDEELEEKLANVRCNRL